MSAAVLDPVTDCDSPRLDDAELVERFAIARDHQAFSDLVYRYSPVVLGVCRRVLHDHHDIEDVFQATFLVFVRDAAKVRKRGSFASWIYGVAYRLALRTTRQKHRRRETILVEDTLVDEAIFQRLADLHDQQIVDAELNSLPETYRQPLVLRYIFEKSPAEIANELKITIGAVDGRLKRGKNELRTRLLKRGSTAGVALASIELAQQAAQAADASALIEATIGASLTWDFGTDTLPTDLFSGSAVELAATEGIAMTAATKATMAAGLTLGAIAAGIGASAMMGGGTGRQAEASGIVTTLPTMRAAFNGTALAVVAADPNDLDQSLASKLAATLAEGREATGNTSTDEGSPDGANGSSAKPDRATNDSLRKPQRAWDFKSRNQNVIKIENALEGPSEVNFVEIPLKEALDYLKELHQVEIQPDVKEFSEQGHSVENTISLAVSGVSLRSILHLMLEPLALDYIVQNEVLVVTSREKADATYETRVYRTTRLPNLKPKELVEIITTSIEPGRWMPRETETELPKSEPTAAVGPGGVLRLGSARATGNTLVIRQTQRIHEEIVELLNQLEQQVTESQDLPLEHDGGKNGGAATSSADRDDVRGDSKPTGGSLLAPTPEARQQKPVGR